MGFSEEGRQTICLPEAVETEKGRSVILIEAEKTEREEVKLSVKQRKLKRGIS